MMKAVVCVCVAAMVLLGAADGQSLEDALCEGIGDFKPCTSEDFNCNHVSQCYCRSQAPYCRCKNWENEFYLGSDCSQKWDVLTFALVASLPGVGLALVTGVIVCIGFTCCGSQKNQDTRQLNRVTIPEVDEFPGVVFASDVKLQPGPHLASPAPRVPQGGVPMTSQRPYSVSNNTPERQPTRGSQFPYSVSNNTPERPPMGGSQLPYSYSAGPGQVLRNPYAKSSRDPYEEHEPYYQPASPSAHHDQRAAPSSGPSYFPRAQLSRGY